MVNQIQAKKGRNLRCISFQYNKEDTFEKKKDLRQSIQGEGSLGSHQGRADDIGDSESV